MNNYSDAAHRECMAEGFRRSAQLRVDYSYRVKEIREKKRLFMYVHKCADCYARGWIDNRDTDYKLVKCSTCKGTGKHKYTEAETKAVFARVTGYE